VFRLGRPNSEPPGEIARKFSFSAALLPCASPRSFGLER
jgi:hypothetical protein